MTGADRAAGRRRRTGSKSARSSRRLRQGVLLAAITSAIPLVLIAFHATSRSDVTIDLTGFIVVALGAGLLELGRAKHSAARRSAPCPKPAPRLAERRTRAGRLD
jgi:hypothetical protein